MMNKNYNVELIKWAFEKGYNLGHADIQEGIHIDFYEIEKLFLNELNEHVLIADSEAALHAIAQ
ncbi:hypothetical protein EAG18_02440 [Pseudoalteromonas sp. J010]|uniref:hypothetical protein n=1 Tax=Pseudoalteromonas sp. J010 TaxID=998465 RepID=UPI000F64FAF6|nr:hypothetical protein [Pseudoalteromonas sp. J010]RRS10435.1 hypothetical protein EAG18_02440 [Pseudoalteromonas sp. J010]